ncbi:hypothetical protein A9239_14590 [Methanosarcina sp. A14]|nr:hypothetical protein A9239_14590 [Methanosarcina sp. A14]
MTFKNLFGYKNSLLPICQEPYCLELKTKPEKQIRKRKLKNSFEKKILKKPQNKNHSFLCLLICVYLLV